MASSNQGNQGGNRDSKQGGGQGSSNRGFASMDPDKQREIASEGGKAAHERGTAHEFNSQEAAEAGRKGGQASHGGGRGGQQDQGQEGGQGSSGRGFASMDPDKQRDIASKGGHASHGGGRQGGGSDDR